MNPIVRMIDKATGFEPISERRHRPRNHPGVDAFIFKINESLFHVEIRDKFMVLPTDKIVALRDVFARAGKHDEECMLLADVIQEVIDGPVPSEADLTKE